MIILILIIITSLIIAILIYRYEVVIPVKDEQKSASIKAKSEEDRLDEIDKIFTGLSGIPTLERYQNALRNQK